MGDLKPITINSKKKGQNDALNSSSNNDNRVFWVITGNREEANWPSFSVNLHVKSSKGTVTQLSNLKKAFKKEIDFKYGNLKVSTLGLCVVYFIFMKSFLERRGLPMTWLKFFSPKLYKKKLWEPNWWWITSNSFHYLEL